MMAAASSLVSRSLRRLLHGLAVIIKGALRFQLGLLHSLVLKIKAAFRFLLRQLRRLDPKMNGAYRFLRRQVRRLALKIMVVCRYLRKQVRRLAVKMLASAYAAFLAGFVAAAAAVSLWQLALIALGQSHRFEPLPVLVYGLLSGAAAAVLCGTLMRKLSKIFPKEKEDAGKGGGKGEEPQKSPEGG